MTLDAMTMAADGVNNGLVAGALEMTQDSKQTRCTCMAFDGKSIHHRWLREGNLAASIFG